MNNYPIGILDSGVGGLTVLAAITQELPHESIIYVGDSANTPYGVKSEEEIYIRAKQLVEFLITRKVKLIVIACNTITVSCLDKLRIDYPDIPLIGTVPVVKTASTVSKSKRIGILSTTGTAKSEYQKKLIEEFAGECTVFNHGNDALVPLLEAGEEASEEMDSVLKKALHTFQEEKVDTLVLGCTHFPFLEKKMSDILGPQVQLLDSGGAVARQVRRVLQQNNALIKDHEANVSIFTTGNIHIAEKLLYSIIKGQQISFEKVSL